MRHWKRWTAAALALAAATAGALALVAGPTTASAPQPGPSPVAGPLIAFSCPNDQYIDLVATTSGDKQTRSPEQITDMWLAGMVEQGAMPAMRGVNAASVRARAYTMDKPHREAWKITDPERKGRVIAAIYMIDNGDGLVFDRSTRCAS